jgi:NADH dehydrogenase (ubiquinone) 1 beta subcomplex subunit 9
LKLLSSWAIDRDIFNDEATKIRARFDQERGCKPEKAIRLLRVSSCKKKTMKAVLFWGKQEVNSPRKHGGCSRTYRKNLFILFMKLVQQEANDELFAFTHPDPYCNPVMPGGSKFMRNPPLPMDVCFPDGNYPANAPKYEVNPDWSKATPENGKAATGYVLVDFGKKNME